MKKWDDREKDNNYPSVIDKLLHPDRMNFIFIDNADSSSDQCKKILDRIEFNKTNCVVSKTWGNK